MPFVSCICWSSFYTSFWYTRVHYHSKNNLRSRNKLPFVLHSRPKRKTEGRAIADCALSRWNNSRLIKLFPSNLQLNLLLIYVGVVCERDKLKSLVALVAFIWVTHRFDWISRAYISDSWLTITRRSLVSLHITFVT